MAPAQAAQPPGCAGSDPRRRQSSVSQRWTCPSAPPDTRTLPRRERAVTLPECSVQTALQTWCCGGKGARGVRVRGGGGCAGKRRGAGSAARAEGPALLGG